MDNHIPPLTPLADLPPVRTQKDLHHLWRILMGPLGFGGRSLWVHLLDADGRSTPVILQIEDLPRCPDRQMRDRLRQFLRHLAEDDGGSIAFLLTRPGRAGIEVGERQWANTLSDVAQWSRLQSWPVHRANDEELVVVTPDDLAATT